MKCHQNPVLEPNVMGPCVMKPTIFQQANGPFFELTMEFQNSPLDFYWIFLVREIDSKTTQLKEFLFFR